MGHSHTHIHDHPHDHTRDHSRRNIAVAFFINLAFTVIEFVGGFFTHSLAIFSDALHDFGDSLALGLAWYFQVISTRNKNEKYSYGYHRFSILGAIINAVILLVGSFIIIWTAIPRLSDPGNPNAQGMIIMAILGVIFNFVAYRYTHGGDSLNEKVVSLHLLEDVLGWVAVLIVGGIMLLGDFAILDPILSILIALFILYNVVKNLKSSLKVILQSTPENIDMTAVNQSLLSIPEICEIHDCHAWTMDGRFNVLTLHVVIKGFLPASEQAELKQKIREQVNSFPVSHVTIEIESDTEHCEEK